MTSPPDLNTPFRKLAQKLPSPLSEQFDAKPWEEAFATYGSTEDDRRLYRGALWVGARARALYATRPVRFPDLRASDAAVLAIAVLNQQYRILSANARIAGQAAAADGPVALDYVSNIRFENAHGQSMSSGDYVEAFVDALDAWLFDAARCPPTTQPPPSDVGKISEPLVRFYTMRHVLKRLYDKILHLGHFLNEDGIWVPHDRRLASLHQAWSSRAEAVFGAAPAQLNNDWGHLNKSERLEWGLARSVRAAIPGRHGMRLKVERLAYLSNRAPHQALTRSGLRHSYLAEFLDQPLPLAPTLTAALIEDAWWICEAAASALAVATARSHGNTLRTEANAIERGTLVDAIATALAVERDVANQLVLFLTYGESPKRKRREAARDSDHGWRGLWTAPLVAIPEEDLLLLPQAVFEHCAPLYRAEAWLEKGGLSDQGIAKEARGKEQRGNRFERSYRAQLCEALSENALLRTSHVAPAEIKKEEKEGGFPEQIDILFKLGDRLFVGELKFLLTPADPHQWGRHYEKLADAAEQARKKAAALAVRRDVAATALGLAEADVAELSITPLIVLNSGFGFSLMVGGCRVVDATYLREFIRSPEFATGGIVKGQKLYGQEITVFYSSEREAARRFDAIMARPSVVLRFLNRVYWDIIDYPSEDDLPLRVACPFRGDMTPSERERRKAMIPQDLL
jgi:hypothetical protein